MPAVLPSLKGLQPGAIAARYQLHDDDWQPMFLGPCPVPGYHWIALPSDSRGAWQAYWMRLDAGASSPQHVHPSTELVQVVEGDFCDEGGARHGAGDVVVYEAGSRHATYSVQGCLVLVIASIEAVVSPEPA